MEKYSDAFSGYANLEWQRICYEASCSTLVEFLACLEIASSHAYQRLMTPGGDNFNCHIIHEIY
jgi:hypothetical protein